MEKNSNEDLKEVKEKKSTRSNKKVNKKSKSINFFSDYKNVTILLAIIIVILVAIIIFLLLGKNGDNTSKSSRKNTKIENGIEINTNNNVTKERDLNGIKFTNVSLTKEQEVGIISAQLINTTTEKQNEFNLDIKFKDKDGNVVLALGDIIPALEPNESYYFSSTVKFDFVNSYDMEVTRVENTK